MTRSANNEGQRLVEIAHYGVSDLDARYLPVSRPLAATEPDERIPKPRLPGPPQLISFLHADSVSASTPTETRYSPDRNA